MKICEDAKVLASIKRKVFDIYRYRYPPPARACIASSPPPASLRRLLLLLLLLETLPSLLETIRRPEYTVGQGNLRWVG